MNLKIRSMLKKRIFIRAIVFLLTINMYSQKIIPIDTVNWKINSVAHVIEKYKGKEAIYLQAGSMTLKNTKFLNGTIEFDVFLKEEQAFPGIYFRVNEFNAEQWFMRPHLSGKPDANQAAPTTNGITPWQLYFGPKYSFPYSYNYEDWTHIKLVVNDNKAQVFLDYAEEPNLSWNLFHPSNSGEIIFVGGNRSGIHIANVSIDKSKTILKNFKPVERKPIESIITEWEISDKFEEKLLSSSGKIDSLIKTRKWQGKIKIEEGTAANISRTQLLRNGKPGNTVFAKIQINASHDQLKLFEFGYSDRVVVILNGLPIYKGTNKWRSRDYRYLGTIGLFDAIYLPLKKGSNELLMAVSEDFGGWLITGRIQEKEGIKVN